MIVLVGGGGVFNDYDLLKSELDPYLSDENLIIISGACRGADTLAIRWAIENNVSYISCPAKWEKYGRIAGIKRNQYMLDNYKPDLVIAFDGGNGTRHMISIARKSNVHVKIIKKGIDNEFI